MQAILASLRYHPGHLSHLLANGRLLSEVGYEVTYRLHPEFQTLFQRADAPKESGFADIVLERHKCLYILWFPSLAGLLDILWMRLLRRPAWVIYVFHEPFVTYRSYRAAGFSRVKASKVYLIHLISSATVSLSNAVIVPSSNAFTAYKSRYSDSGKSIQVVPLMFEDEALTGVPGRAGRRFISYIGTVAEDHAFDRFIDFAEQAIQRQLVGSLHFQLVTRSVLDADLTLRLAPLVASGQMRVQSGRPLSNVEINSAFAGSLVVWNAYTRSMQSGVLPKAYMFGTPVLVSEANTSEFFEDGRHGASVSTRYDVVELATAVGTIAANFERISEACREAFLKHFHYRANAANFLAALT